MFDSPNDQQEKRREDLAVLKDEAITKLEHRGYAVRGKTPTQIRQILRRRPRKNKSED
jgi:hypothetical protein